MPGRQHLLLQQNSLSALQDKEYKLKSQARRIFQPVHHMPPESGFIIFSLPQTIVLCAHVGNKAQSDELHRPATATTVCPSATQLYLCHLFSQPILLPEPGHGWDGEAISN